MPSCRRISSLTIARHDRPACGWPSSASRSARWSRRCSSPLSRGCPLECSRSRFVACFTEGGSRHQRNVPWAISKESQAVRGEKRGLDRGPRDPDRSLFSGRTGANRQVESQPAWSCRTAEGQGCDAGKRREILGNKGLTGSFQALLNEIRCFEMQGIRSVVDPARQPLSACFPAWNRKWRRTPSIEAGPPTAAGRCRVVQGLGALTPAAHAGIKQASYESNHGPQHSRGS